MIPYAIKNAWSVDKVGLAVLNNKLDLIFS